MLLLGNFLRFMGCLRSIRAQPDRAISNLWELGRQSQFLSLAVIIQRNDTDIDRAFSPSRQYVEHWRTVYQVGPAQELHLHQITFTADTWNIWLEEIVLFHIFFLHILIKKNRWNLKTAQLCVESLLLLLLFFFFNRAAIFFLVCRVAWFPVFSVKGARTPALPFYWLPSH